MDITDLGLQSAKDVLKEQCPSDWCSSGGESKKKKMGSGSGGDSDGDCYFACAIRTAGNWEQDEQLFRDLFKVQKIAQGQGLPLNMTIKFDSEVLPRPERGITTNNMNEEEFVQNVLGGDAMKEPATLQFFVQPHKFAVELACYDPFLNAQEAVMLPLASVQRPPDNVVLSSGSAKNSENHKFEAFLNAQAVTLKGLSSTEIDDALLSTLAKVFSLPLGHGPHTLVLEDMSGEGILTTLVEGSTMPTLHRIAVLNSKGDLPLQEFYSLLRNFKNLEEVVFPKQECVFDHSVVSLLCEFKALHSHIQFSTNPDEINEEQLTIPPPHWASQLTKYPALNDRANNSSEKDADTASTAPAKREGKEEGEEEMLHFRTCSVDLFAKKAPLVARARQIAMVLEGDEDHSCIPLDLELPVHPNIWKLAFHFLENFTSSLPDDDRLENGLVNLGALVWNDELEHFYVTYINEGGSSPSKKPKFAKLGQLLSAGCYLNAPSLKYFCRCSYLRLAKGVRHVVREVRALVLGLDGAGKTVALYKLKLGEVVTTVPTIGFNVETVNYKNTKYTMWDVGGQDKLRGLWRHYYQGTNCIIFVVNSGDRDRIALAREELHKVLEDDDLRDACLLVLANKQDLPIAMSCTEVCDRLGLHALRQRNWYIQGCSGLSGEGLYEGLDWLEANVKLSQRSE